VSDNSVVPDDDKPGLSKELLHEVNNQRGIVVNAAEFLSLQYSDPWTKEYGAQIQAAVFKTFKLLKTHFQEAIRLQPAPNAVHESDMPVAVDRA
jgi:hypothetical protein